MPLERNRARYNQIMFGFKMNQFNFPSGGSFLITDATKSDSLCAHKHTYLTDLFFCCIYNPLPLKRLLYICVSS